MNQNRGRVALLEQFIYTSVFFASNSNGKFSFLDRGVVCLKCSANDMCWLARYRFPERVRKGAYSAFPVWFINNLFVSLVVRFAWFELGSVLTVLTSKAINRNRNFCELDITFFFEIQRSCFHLSPPHTSPIARWINNGSVANFPQFRRWLASARAERMRMQSRRKQREQRNKCLIRWSTYLVRDPRTWIHFLKCRLSESAPFSQRTATTIPWIISERLDF